MSRLHLEKHSAHRVGWLRAAVLGANDGLVSTASLIVGVAAAAATNSNILIAGTAGLVAGAMSMAAGEYVSVSSQSDTEEADLTRERKGRKTNDCCRCNRSACPRGTWHFRNDDCSPITGGDDFRLNLLLRGSPAIEYRPGHIGKVGYSCGR
jgi:VIT family